MSQDKEKMFLKGTDENGKPIHVSRDEWKDKVLPEMIEQTWDDLNMLYSVISLACDNDMPDQVLDAARHAYETDTIAERASTMYSIVLIRNGLYADALKVLEDYIQKEGKTATILSCLARTHKLMGQNDLFSQTLIEAIDLDPNDEIILTWWLENQREGQENPDDKAALLEIAKKDGTWRAQTWLAHMAIENNEKFEAIDFYKQALEKSDACQEAVTLSAMDLVQAGHVIELIDLMEQFYDPVKHEVDAGIHLVQAYIQTGQKIKGIQMLNHVEAKRPELGEQIFKMRQNLANLPDEKVN